MSASLALVLAAATDLDSVDFFLPNRDTPLKLINEAGSLSEHSAFFLGGFEFGPTHLVHVEAYRGDGFEAAYEAWVDSFPEIDAADLPEAYCDPRDPDQRTFEEIARARLDEEKPYPSHKEPEARDAWYEEKNALAKGLLAECAEAAHENGDNYPEIVDGYREDSNGRVKDLGHHENFYEADLASIEVRPKTK